LSSDRGWGAGGIGAMLAGFGLGACVSGLVMLRFRPTGRAGLMVAGCLALQGLSVIAPALTHRLPFAVIATAVAGLTSGPAAILLTTLGQSRTDDAFRGRV